MNSSNKPPTHDFGPTDNESAADRNSGMLKRMRQLIVFVLGMSVVLVGIAMIVLPGPATIVIPAGLAILATEFVWARRWLNYMKQRARDVVEWTVTAAQPDSAVDLQPPEDESAESPTVGGVSDGSK